jgi:hypothetical protein
MEIESLISRSCIPQKTPKSFQDLHVAIVKKCYNAADVSIDYHRKRVVMDIVMDDTSYDPEKPNVRLPLLRANLLFRNLSDFLKSCVQKDRNSLAFYARLMRSYETSGSALPAV